STWFRDYLYVPLGGNRVSPARRYTNLVTVFFLCGLWHGASWNFVIWGLWHGTFLVLERLIPTKPQKHKTTKPYQQVQDEPDSFAWFRGFAVSWRHLYTLTVVMIG